jgi:hypothetical protein
VGSSVLQIHAQREKGEGESRKEKVRAFGEDRYGGGDTLGVSGLGMHHSHTVHGTDIYDIGTRKDIFETHPPTETSLRRLTRITMPMVQITCVMNPTMINKAVKDESCRIIADSCRIIVDSWRSALSVSCRTRILIDSMSEEPKQSVN